MKIGVLTYFWAENPGTFLQAYSMLKALERRFLNDQVELVNYRHRWVYFKPGRSNVTLRQFIRDFKRYLIYERMKKKYLVTSNDQLITRDSERAWKFIEDQQYDLIVVGSDTMLELLSFHYRDESVPVYWLPTRLNCKKVMCAASAGAMTYEQLNNNQRDACKKSINSFDLIGVRDDATYTLIEMLGLEDKSKLQMVPDPTFTFDIDYTHAERFVHKRNIDFSRPTIALFLHRTFKPAAEVAAYFRSKGFQVLSLNAARYADFCLTDISPFEWAGIYRDLRLVITGAFHGTVFSLKNLIPVVSVAYEKRLITNEGLSKYYSLLKQFGLHNSNLINGIDHRDAGTVIEVAERAVCNFNRQMVRKRNRQLRDEFNAFADKVVCLLD